MGRMDILRQSWHRLRRILWETVYPEGAICLGCGKISQGACLCGECRQLLRKGEMLESWNMRDLNGVDAWSLKPHKGLARTLVLRLKHSAEACAAGELAGILEDRPEYFPMFPADTVVTWVPGPKSRIRERCVDHGRLLAEAMAEQLGLRCERLLDRRGKDRPQARLNRAQREKNLSGAFAPAGEIHAPVLLVDDVLTTGTTAERCIRALREAGAKEITVLTATHSVR